MKEVLLKKARRRKAKAVVLGAKALDGPMAVKKLSKAMSTVRKLPKIPSDWGRKKSVAYVPRGASRV